MMAERTGTALRPAPGSSAKRMPVIAGAGSPALVAMRAARDPRVRERRCSFGDPMRRLTKTSSDGRGAQHDDQADDAETEHGPVEREARVFDAADRTERRERRQSDRDATGQQCPEHHGTDHAEQAVADRHCRTRSQRAQHGALVAAAAELATDQLTDDAAAPPSAAIAPNTPSAIDSGSIARSAFATKADVTTSLLIDILQLRASGRSPLGPRLRSGCRPRP